MNDNHPFETRIDTIINADCLQELSHFPDNSIDLTVFSPPYDEIRDFGWITNIFSSFSRGIDQNHSTKST